MGHLVVGHLVEGHLVEAHPVVGHLVEAHHHGYADSHTLVHHLHTRLTSVVTLHRVSLVEVRLPWAEVCVNYLVAVLGT